ncbi:excinuclease ABC subunit C [Candidatus Falkowbacteria bacterium RIFOXYC2_FULL_47_12]|uniref:Excinuclease ABC subunit C n=2 Tax=Candidatus Falkowiibacteriota TaxID=1752728 RepID=A0A1F5TMN3_9BACT|nr:MAG: excinuclease ABC subunit C [Candidatus Falkowbacteria bacterium RIFOXYA2_FULL_47_9]OGF40136.1 MAG: excinuclease ABC subunit C [Candidatus Falkowbacteria bacterium RIFOXYC2_FULL_47_12]
MRFYYVYILESQKDSSLYKGCTNNLIRRISEHNNGLVEATKFKKPWKLIYYEACLNIKDAYNREKYLKMGGGRRFVSKRLECYFNAKKDEK